MAPILTYTMDELLAFAPAFYKRWLWRYFDYKKVELPNVESNY